MRDHVTFGRWGRFFYYRSRDPASLWGMVIVILGAGIFTAYGVDMLRDRPVEVEVPFDVASLLQPFPISEPDDVDGVDVTSILSLIDQHRTAALEQFEFPQWFEEAAPRLVGGQWETVDRIRESAAKADLQPEQRALVLAFAESVAAGQGPNEALLAHARAEPAQAHADYAVFRAYWQIGDITAGLAALKEEAARPAAHEARSRLVEAALARHRPDVLAGLQDDPLYADEFDDYTLIQLATQNHDWLAVTELVVTRQYVDLPVRAVALAALVALAWLTFLVQASQPGRLLSGRVLLCLVAVVLGVMSTWGTLVADRWQEEVMGIVERDDVLGAVIYFVAGVGLREELMKLLFLLPLVPLLIRRGSELEMLIVAGCVGLGFAAEENLGYYAREGGVAAVGRFATANLFHIALTGAVGLWFCRALRWPRQCFNHFAVVFTAAVVVHGLYDTVIVVPELAGLGIASFLLFLVACYQFFSDLHDTREVRRDTVSISATFIAATCVVIASTMVVLSYEAGFSAALTLSVTGAIQSALAIYVVLRELPGSLVTV